MDMGELHATLEALARLTGADSVTVRLEGAERDLFFYFRWQDSQWSRLVTYHALEVISLDTIASMALDALRLFREADRNDGATP